MKTNSASSGLQADKRATASLNVTTSVLSTGSVTPRSEAGEQTVVHTTLKALQSQLSAVTETREYTVVKLGLYLFLSHYLSTISFLIPFPPFSCGNKKAVSVREFCVGS